jgi:hypothetical protein
MQHRSLEILALRFVVGESPLQAQEEYCARREWSNASESCHLEAMKRSRSLQ